MNKEVIKLESMLIKSMTISCIEFILSFVIPLIIINHFVYNKRYRFLIAVLLLIFLLSYIGGYIAFAGFIALLIFVCIVYENKKENVN